MDDRTQQPGRDPAINRSAPSASGTSESSLNGRLHVTGATGASGDEQSSADWSSSPKAALTDRERNERWPVG